MNKTVLFLINGLGVERKDSYNIYSSQLMPNLDSLISEALFTKLTSPATDLENAYKYFSIGNLAPLTFPYIQNILENNLLIQNPKFDQFHQAVFNCQGNIHFFCFLEDEKTHDAVKKFIQAIDAEGNKKIYLHFILPQTDTSQYPFISKLLARYQYDLPSNVQRGLVFGQAILEDESKLNERNDLVRMLFKGIGEKWREVDTKLTSLSSLHVSPNNAKAFYINDGFVLGENDLLFFYNYKDYDCTSFINSIKNSDPYLNNSVVTDNISCYSLFPLKNKENVSYLYEDVVSDISVAKALEQIGGTALVMTDKENIHMVNFMCNGLSNESNSHVKYVLTDNGILFQREQMRVVLNDPTYQLIVINHRIDHINDEITMKQELQKIDQNIAMILDLCKNQYTLLISSLFGIKKEIVTANSTKAVVDFSGIVPAILVDSKYDSKNYRLSSSDTYSLLTTSLKCIKPELKVNSLLRKKGLVESILFKKK